MASREGDIALWLHNKLSSIDDLWSGSSICSQLSRDKLVGIQDCFHNLQPSVKLKLLLSFLHLPKRRIDEWRSELEEIINIAQDDTDQWVGMVGNIIKSFPTQGSLNTDIEDHHNFFHEVLNDLKKLVKKACETDMPPLECLYLGRAALSSVAGPTPSSSRHFSLKRKPKSASLRMELLQKSSEAASNLKKTGSLTTVPVKSRSFAKKMDDDTTPLRGLPSHTSTSSGGFLKASTLARSFGGNSAHRSLASRREGGIKVLEIAEQPLTGREAKRRRKQLEQEALEKQRAADKEAAAANAATPDYAVSLVNLQPTPKSVAPVAVSLPLPATTTASVLTTTPTVVSLVVTSTQPSYLPAVSRLVSAPQPATQPVQVSLPGGGHATIQLQQPAQLPQPATGVRFSLSGQNVATTVALPVGASGGTAVNIAAASAAPQRAGAPRAIATPLPIASPTVTPTRIVLNTNQPGVARLTAVVRPAVRQVVSQNAVSLAGPTALTLQARPQAIAIQRPQQTLMQSQPAAIQSAIRPAIRPTVQIVQQQQMQVQQQQQHVLQTQQMQVQQQQQMQVQQQQQQPQHVLQTQQMQVQQQQPKKCLQLTKEQMLQAQEMFRTSNKVTRPEKALILGFMAGSRDNPCPQQGHIVNIRLSESQESIQQPDLTFRPMLVDTYFQMNYSTGEWKRIKKYREIEPE